MRRQIRSNVFETNSSSTHSICVAKDISPIIPESIHFSFGEFGWECDTLGSVSEKASYLYTGLIANERSSDFDNIVTALKFKGVKVSFEEPIYKGENSWAENGGYVDHSSDLTEFLDAIVSDDEKLMSYLFSPLSYVITGNDNDDTDVRIDATYPHDEYYKGN